MNRSPTTRAVSASLLALSLCSAAHANLLVNGSFESGNFNGDSNDVMSLGVGSTTIIGWTVVSDAVGWIWDGSRFSLSASEGNLFLDLTDYAGGAPFGGVQQTVATTVGMTYRLSFDLGSSDLYGLPDTISASAGGTTQSFSSPISGAGDNRWETVSMEFTAASTSTVVSLQGQAGIFYVGLDNVVLTPVPEPASAAMALAGLAALGGLVRRRRRG